MLHRLVVLAEKSGPEQDLSYRHRGMDTIGTLGGETVLGALHCHVDQEWSPASS